MLLWHKVGFYVRNGSCAIMTQRKARNANRLWVPGRLTTKLTCDCWEYLRCILLLELTIMRGGTPGLWCSRGSVVCLIMDGF